MKFVYTYRTRDNVLHEGIVKAATKDAAYALLKGQGIKPGQMKEAPGFFNKLFGKYKRWIAIVGLAAFAAFLLVVVNYQDAVIAEVKNNVDVVDVDGPIDRRQLLGDDTVIARGVETEWAVVFPRESDRFLAKFAQPGHPVPRVDPQVASKMAEEIQVSLGEPIPVNDSDLDEYKQIKRIVAGMRKELEAYLKDGGSVAEYIDCLVQRQSYEVSLRHKASMELRAIRRKVSGDEYMAEWKKVNLELRAIGLALIPIEGE